MVPDLAKNFFKNKSRNYVLIAQVLGAIMALISGKLIAVYVSPVDFGTYGIQFAAYTFFSTLLISPFIQFIKTGNKTMLPRVGTKTYLFTLFILVLVAYICLISFLNLYYDIGWGGLFILLLAFMILVTSNSVLSDFLNINNQLKVFSKLSILTAFGRLAFISIFYSFGLSFISNVYVLWAMQLMGLALGLFIFITKYPIYKNSYRFGYITFIKRYFRFGGPLIFLAVWAWINNYFDRYAIEYFLSLSEVGIYNASYGVGSKFFLLLSPLFMILVTPYVYAKSKVGIKKNTISIYSKYYILMAIPVLIIVFFLRDTIGSFLLSESYKDGFYLIFWIALAFFILTMTQLHELVFYAEQKTKVILIGNMFAAIFNILLNIILIPKYGILGAGIATVSGFFVHFIFVYSRFLKL